MKTPMLIFTAILPFASLAQDYDSRFLKHTFPDIEVLESRPSELEGMVELILADGQVIYLSKDGKRLLSGNLLDLETGSNLTELRRDDLRARKLMNLNIEDLFEYPSDDEQAMVTVVTDIDCPYCRRLHQQMADYNALGISVRYLMMPRSGPETPSFAKANNAACAADPNQALTRSMSGETLPSSSCSNTIRQQFDLARSLMPTGTPAVITASGRIFHGYVPPEKLAMALQLSSVK